jgi:purine-binding chemotaxis protein CheW
MRDIVALRVGEALLGVDSAFVDDVFHPRGLTPAPMAPPEVLGVLNLRGRIVTALCLRRRLGMPPRPEDAPALRAVGVEIDEDLYGLVVDGVDSVMKIDPRDRFSPPSSLGDAWAEIVSSVVRLPDELLLIVDVRRLVLAEAERA